MTDGVVSIDGGGANTSPSLLARLKNHDGDAWRRFVHLYGPLVYRWCRQAGLRESDAADVGQDVFETVARAITDFRHDRKGDSFRGWLRAITRNKARDFLRNLPVEGTGVGGSEALTRLYRAPAEEADDDPTAEEDRFLAMRRAIEAFLVGCKEETRQAFIRLVVDKHAPADVAQDLGLSVNAVYLLKSRTLRQFREEYAELLDLD